MGSGPRTGSRLKRNRPGFRRRKIATKTSQADGQDNAIHEGSQRALGNGCGWKGEVGPGSLVGQLLLGRFDQHSTQCGRRRQDFRGFHDARDDHHRKPGRPVRSGEKPELRRNAGTRLPWRMAPESAPGFLRSGLRCLAGGGEAWRPDCSRLFVCLERKGALGARWRSRNCCRSAGRRRAGPVLRRIKRQEKRWIARSPGLAPGAIALDASRNLDAPGVGVGRKVRGTPPPGSVSASPGAGSPASVA